MNIIKLLKTDVLFWRKKKPEKVEAKVKTGGLPFTINPYGTTTDRHTQRIERIKDTLEKMDRKKIDNPVRKEKLEMELRVRTLALEAAKLQRRVD